jgi:hypothetical protein
MLRVNCYADKWTDYIKAGSNSCSPQLLEELAHSEVDLIRIRVAENPVTPLEILEILAADKNADVRIAVGTNPSTPAHISYGLAFDEDPNVRLGLAEDMNTPVELLEKLAEDTNPYVSCRAAQTKEYIAALAQANTSGCHRFFRWENIGVDLPERKYA